MGRIERRPLSTEISRRAFVVGSLAAGFALAVMPVSAETITTDSNGLVAGEVKIPVAGPPTMELTDASTTWRLRLRLQMSGCPNTASAFEIEVLPGVARL